MELQELLEKAQEAVLAAEIKEDLRGPAFEKAFEYLAGLQQPGVHPAERGAGPGVSDRGEILGGVGLSRIAEQLGVESSQVAEVFFEDSGELSLSLPSNKLAKEKRAATRQIALLVAAGRQAGGFEDTGWTASDIIRDACDHYGKFDSKNFADTLSRMDSLFHLRGKARGRQVRLKQPGFEAAAGLIRDIASSGS